MQVLVYLRKCLWASAGVADWRALHAHPNEHTPTVGRYLRQLAQGEGVDAQGTTNSLA